MQNTQLSTAKHVNLALIVFGDQVMYTYIYAHFYFKI